MPVNKLSVFRDERGDLVPIEFENLPFVPKRLFYVTNVPAGVERGGHAHYVTQQFLICIKGFIVVRLHDGRREREMVITPGKTVLIKPYIWDSQQFSSIDDVLLVLCNTNYNQADYITDFKEFLQITEKIC